MSALSTRMYVLAWFLTYGLRIDVLLYLCGMKKRVFIVVISLTIRRECKTLQSTAARSAGIRDRATDGMFPRDHSRAEDATTARWISLATAGSCA